jgi:predicted nucleic acid-binding protein
LRAVKQDTYQNKRTLIGLTPLPYLIEIISQERLPRFLLLLQSLCEEIPLITAAIPPITRDPKDDYLIAYAVIGQADHLVSGDKDLLILQTPGSVAILNPAQFRQMLSKQYS